VSLRLREVLTADDASIARQQGTLAQLKRSVLALEDAESARSQRLQAAQAQQARISAALLPYLGRLQRSSDDSRWELWLAPDARVSIARARRIETDINAGRPQGDDTLLVVPALQALPVIALGPAREDDAGPDPAQRVMLDAQAWALQRWRSGRVDAVLATADDAQAEAWEQALRAALAARQVPVATLTRVRDGEARLQLALAPD
jgi:hypothetical protein